MVSFEEACELAKNFSKKPSDSEFLEFYGLFKQATVGDCNIEKPGALDLKKKAMWEAWNKHQGLSQDAAKAAYVQVYEKYAPKYA
ncbi:putative acyl-CoA-binding protein [Lucilia cuprina]|uniref:Putative acyl-CoA-binding protein n=1 Tax=Lucilia cuprina TaxID=7375 RepID=A0A0L0CBS2_LUCCU|nr:acyl-CoA-binding protein-like [Lucilia cuprina]XP_037810444.1 acyl-CoA-binding protein-like [Lucilia sericata]XP_037810461.1 acyl-CoA-binding protein [Lucilia sericata]KAI8126012.1 Acyl-CoA-binding protein like protein [Lucilia cuprina]KAI8126347.1 Acyl-CoA-binding protein like protein [Lucilia cuprina]KNC29863.1 putative acyl-CoA-binding protein [Lucilia cuprina]